MNDLNLNYYYFYLKLHFYDCKYAKIDQII